VKPPCSRNSIGPIEGKWTKKTLAVNSELALICLASRESLPVIHWKTVNALEQATSPCKTELLTTITVEVLSICQQFVWEVAVENHSVTEENPEKRNRRRELAHNIDVTLSGDKEQVEHQVKLSEMCEKNVEETKEGPGQEERGPHMSDFETVWATN